MSFKTLHIALFIFFGSFCGVAQGVCDLTGPNVEKGNFDAVLRNACGNTAVDVTDLSGGTNIRYHYNYKGESINQLTNTTASTSEALFIIDNKPTTYTILQYGSKNGKPMYACKEVFVRPNNEPLFSYNTCNNNQLEISISDSSINSFDYYTIDWGGGLPIETIDKSQLPFSSNRALNMPRTISVLGHVSGSNASSCPAPPPISIPIYTPANFPNGYDNPNKSNIDKLVLVSPESANLTFRGSYNPNGFTLLMKEQGPGDFNDNHIIRSGLLPGTLNISIPDSAKSYCFQLRSEIPCGLEYSAVLCTIPLSEVSINNLSHILNWSTYPNTITSFDDPIYGRYLVKSQKVIRETESLQSEIIATSNQTQYIDNITDCQEQVCYRIELSTSGQLYYNQFSGLSISNTRCVDRKTLKAPSLNNLFASVNLDNSIVLNFEDNSNWSIPKISFSAYHNTDTGYAEISTVTSVADFTITNLRPDILKQCFKIGYEDECGTKSELSPEVCTIHLSEIEEILYWTSESPFAPDLPMGFEIEELLPNPSILGNTASHQFAPDLSTREELIQFRIITRDTQGNISYSNVIEVSPGFKLFIPDAFSPNQDGHNEVFKLYGKLKLFDTFSLSLYDRWGNKIINFDTPDFVWDGEINNTRILTGPYTLKISGVLKNGEVINLKKSLLVLK